MEPFEVPENYDTILAIAALSVIAIGAIYKLAKYLTSQETLISRAKEGKLAEKAQNK